MCRYVNVFSSKKETGIMGKYGPLSDTSRAIFYV